MRDNNIKKLVMTALFAALTTVMTMVIRVPTPTQGFVNLGDCAVLMSAWVLGPVWGGAAAGIGSMLADVLASYVNYAPGTLIIKFFMALVAGLIFKALNTDTHGRRLTAQVVGGVVAEAIMVLGYFSYCAVFLSYGMAAAADIPGNLVQGIMGLVIAVIVYSLLDAARVFQRIKL